jgi:hypothetical protein
MRSVEYKDKDGYTRQTLVRDYDPDTAAPQGIPLDPPDLRALDIEGALRDLHNELAARKLYTWLDVQRAGNEVTASILAAFRRRVIALYRQKSEGGNV